MCSIEFDDTYDGLGDQLDEANDDFNDDTFGVEGLSTTATPKPVGKDFDFFGQTAKVSEVLNEEQARFSRQQAPAKPSLVPKAPPKLSSKPLKTGYESYKNSGYIPDLKVNADIWGSDATPTSRASASQQAESSRAPAKKMMSLEEVEASMRSQPKKPTSVQAPQQKMETPSSVHHQHPSLQYAQAQPARSAQAQNTPLSMPPAYETPRNLQAEPLGFLSAARGQPSNPTQILQRVQPLPPSFLEPREPSQPQHILQNAVRQQAQLAPRPPESQLLPHFHSHLLQSGPSYGLSQQPAITHPHQLQNLSAEERTAFLLEEEKRAKRNHKIFLLSKDNGLMTPQDKNFVTRIQLQQLMTATGTFNDNDPDASLSEDFYYQVHNQIRGGPRQNPLQPLSNFAQTYLLQTGGRQAGLSRKQHRGGDNHMQRMEQQVQRAVEAAKLKPKSKQLVIQGSLGKISFSNANTPKPLLNIKRQDNSDFLRRPQHAERQANGKPPSSGPVSTSDRKTILKNIERVYGTLMKMEDLERRLPPYPADEADSKLIQQHVEWRDNLNNLNKKLWSELKVMEPIVHESPILHPFIAFLSYPKGKKAIPRIFRQIDQEQRLTILTMIVIHLNVLDVIRQAQPQPHGAQLPFSVREEIELFSQAVMPNIFAYINEAPFNVVIGLIGLILDHVNIKAIARAKMGLNFLTMLISRVELLKQGDAPDSQEWDQWLHFYNRLFDAIEPTLPEIFPGPINAGQDEYVWRYLAASGISANPDQQQRLVIGVK
jgi:DNA topoisomerase 2-associated protein PAT1